jgi:hypothetical protein
MGKKPFLNRELLKSTADVASLTYKIPFAVVKTQLAQVRIAVTFSQKHLNRCPPFSRLNKLPKE